MDGSNSTTIIQQDDQSTAQVLATGSQDVAAIAGLFCTDGVERNALASEYGYATVISSGLSILGILGLVKSSVKLALGLQQCISSGFNPDSLRGIFGYLISESERAAGETISCLRVSITHTDDNIIIEKERQRFDKDKVPMLAEGWNDSTCEEDAPATVVNLGNMIREREFAQSPWLIGLFTIICSGLTSWVIIIVSWNEPDPWHWTVYLATIGLHISLITMLAPALWHAHQTCRPSLYLNGRLWRYLTRTLENEKPYSRTINFMRTHKKARGGYHQVLHFRGNVTYLTRTWFKALMLVASAVCVASYICQYTVLKSADSTPAAAWISVQAAFAFLRLLLWLYDPPFDDPRTRHAEYVTVHNLDFHIFSLIRIVTDFLGDGETDFTSNPNLDSTRRIIKIPMWAFEYMQHNDLGTALKAAKYEHAVHQPQASKITHSGTGDPEKGASTPTPSTRIPKVNGQDVTDQYHLETNLTRLLGLHESFRAELRDITQSDDHEFTDLRLHFLHKSNDTTLSSVQPLVLMRTIKESGLSDARLQKVDLDDEEDMDNFRYAGKLGSDWTPIPARPDMSYLEAPHAVSKIWRAPNVTLEENGKGTFTRLEASWTDSVSIELRQDEVKILSHFFNLDYSRLASVPESNEHSAFLDMRNIPMARSFTVIGRLSRETPGDWVQRSAEQHAMPLKKAKQNWVTFDFESGEKLMRFIATYTDYDSELSALYAFKRLSKASMFLDSEKRSRGINWIPDGWWELVRKQLESARGPLHEMMDAALCDSVLIPEDTRQGGSIVSAMSQQSSKS